MQHMKTTKKTSTLTFSKNYKLGKQYIHYFWMIGLADIKTHIRNIPEEL